MATTPHITDRPVPGVTDDPVLSRLLTGEAATLYEAEEQFLDAALPDIVALVRGPLDDDALARHPWMRLLLAHGSRGWEDSLL